MKYWQMVKDMTTAEFIELQVAVYIRKGLEYLYTLFPVDSVVNPKGDHTTHEWHVVQFDLADDLNTVWVIVFDPKANVTAKFNIEDLFPDGILRKTYFKINTTTSEN